VAPRSQPRPTILDSGSPPDAKPQGKRARVQIPHAIKRPYLPDRRGFTDCFYGPLNSYWATYDLDGSDVKPPKHIRKEGYRLDIQSDAALAFIDRHAEKPFFLYLAYFAPHVPLEATDKYLKRFPGEMPERRRTALAMISAMDDGVGRIRARLKKHGIDKRTLIFFISDNGAPLKMGMEDKPLSIKGAAWDGSRNDPWVGEKGTLAEGGIRVPFVAAWPGTIPAGLTYDHPVISLDAVATALAIAGLSVAPELDGVNLIPHLTGKKDAAPHEALYWRFWSQSAIRKGKWKYLQTGDRRFLFDLGSPDHEKANLIEKHPEIAKDLAAQLKNWADEQKNPGVAIQKPNSQEVKFYKYYFGE
jgi:arylsulfatase A-like enzyme